MLRITAQTKECSRLAINWQSRSQCQCALPYFRFHTLVSVLQFLYFGFCTSVSVLRFPHFTCPAPPPCNRSPLIFGVWAAGQSSRNVNLYFLYWRFILCSKELINKFVSSFIWDKCHSSVMLCSCSSNSTFKTTLPQTFIDLWLHHS